MVKITQEQLIESLNQLKEIKPKKEWAVLLKSQILTEQMIDEINNITKRENFLATYSK